VPGPTIFRAPFTRVSRGLICLVLALGIAWAIHAEITTANIQTGTRAGWLAATILMEVVMLGGLWRLWAACLIVDESGVTVRNFRGDLHFRRVEIKEVVRDSDFAGFHVTLRLKKGDELGLDGITWMTPSRTDRAAAEITQALGLAPAVVEADSA
jgi:hypothetical protein